MSSSIRDAAKKAMSAKLHKLGAQGSLKAAHGAEDAPRKYASGGAVMDMGDVDGAPSKGNLAKPGRGKMKGKDKKGTNVNVIIMQQPAGDKGAPPPLPPMGGPGGPPPPDMGPPPSAPPMRANGGRVPHIKEGAGSGMGRLAKMRAYGK
jgi:hypothetical protein